MPVKKGRLSGDEEEMISALAELGRSAGQIAVRLNRHAGTINFAMHRMGLKAPVARSFDYTRANGSAVKSFSPEEDAFIEALRIQHFTYEKIAEVSAKRFGHQRTPATIGIRLKMLANLAEA